MGFASVLPRHVFRHYAGKDLYSRQNIRRSNLFSYYYRREGSCNITARFSSTQGNGNSFSSRLKRGFWRWKWVSIPITVAGGIFVYEKISRYQDVDVQPAKNWQVAWYRFLPLKTLSRLWGWIHDRNLPEWSRGAILSVYSSTFGCNLSEADIEDLRQYKNLGEFFRRALKDGARPIHPDDIVSPSDGKVLHFGQLHCGEIEQVKGVNYSLPAFIGLPTWKNKLGQVETGVDEPSILEDCDKYSSFISHHKDTHLYQFVVYLAPGDYHRFHSPTSWNVSFRRHFAGDLLSVNPKIAKLVRGLFHLNERVVYVGEWQHGFFCFAAIGATNVGSIRIYEDDDLKTNSWKYRKGTQFDYSFSKSLRVGKGEPFGEFNLGSTIVLIFEGPKDLEFTVSPGESILVGKPFLRMASKAKQTDVASKDCQC